MTNRIKATETTVGQRVLITTGSTKTNSLQIRRGVVTGHGVRSIGANHSATLVQVRLEDGTTVEDHRVTADPDAASFEAERTPEEILITTIQVLGCDFTSHEMYTHKPVTVTNEVMVGTIRNAAKYGVKVTVKQGTDAKYIELHDGNGSAYGQYLFQGE